MTGSIENNKAVGFDENAIRRAKQIYGDQAGQHLQGVQDVFNSGEIRIIDHAAGGTSQPVSPEIQAILNNPNVSVNIGEPKPGLIRRVAARVQRFLNPSQR